MLLRGLSLASFVCVAACLGFLFSLQFSRTPRSPGRSISVPPFYAPPSLHAPAIYFLSLQHLFLAHFTYNYMLIHQLFPSSLPALPSTQSFPGICSTAISEAVFNLTIGGLAAMAVQSALIWKDVNWQVRSWREGGRVGRKWWKSVEGGEGGRGEKEVGRRERNTDTFRGAITLAFVESHLERMCVRRAFDCLCVKCGQQQHSSPGGSAAAASFE